MKQLSIILLLFLLISCNDDSTVEQMVTFQGFAYYADVNEQGNWIPLSNTEVDVVRPTIGSVGSSMTDETGYYFFEVPASQIVVNSSSPIIYKEYSVQFALDESLSDYQQVASTYIPILVETRQDYVLDTDYYYGRVGNFEVKSSQSSEADSVRVSFLNDDPLIQNTSVLFYSEAPNPDYEYVLGTTALIPLAYDPDPTYTIEILTYQDGIALLLETFDRDVDFEVDIDVELN